MCESFHCKKGPMIIVLEVKRVYSVLLRETLFLISNNSSGYSALFGTE